MTCTTYGPLVEQLHRRLAEALAPRRRRFRRTGADRQEADLIDKTLFWDQRLRAKAARARTRTFGSLKPKRRLDLWLTLGLPKGNRRSD